MSPPTAATLSLVSGSLALDFVNTASGRGTSQTFDHLSDGADLLAWAGHSGAVSAETGLRCEAAIAGDDGAAILRRAIHLREAIYRIGAGIAHGEAPARPDLDFVKEAARRAIGPAELAATPGNGYRFDFSGAPAEAALLGPIAWSAIELLASPTFARVKQCPGDSCGWLFLDQSKNNSRRWCDMATCGNRLKGRRHRERH